jgi:hypothetical protein
MYVWQHPGTCQQRRLQGGTKIPSLQSTFPFSMRWTQQRILQINSCLWQGPQPSHSHKEGTYPCSPKGGLTLPLQHRCLVSTATSTSRGGETTPTPNSADRGGRERRPTTGNQEQSLLQIESTLQKLGHTMYDKAAINLELTAQSGVNPGNATSVIQRLHCPHLTIPSLLGDAWRAATCHHDTNPGSLLLHQFGNQRLPRPGVGVY